MSVFRFVVCIFILMSLWVSAKSNTKESASKKLVASKKRATQKTKSKRRVKKSQKALFASRFKRRPKLNGLPLLKHQQFVNLPRYQKIHYIKELRLTLVALGRDNPMFVQNLLRNDPLIKKLFGAVLPQAHARESGPGVGYYGTTRRDPVNYVHNCTEEGRYWERDWKRWGIVPYYENVERARSGHAKCVQAGHALAELAKMEIIVSRYRENLVGAGGDRTRIRELMSKIDSIYARYPKAGVDSNMLDDEGRLRYVAAEDDEYQNYDQILNARNEMVALFEETDGLEINMARVYPGFSPHIDVRRAWHAAMVNPQGLEAPVNVQIADEEPFRPAPIVVTRDVPNDCPAGQLRETAESECVAITPECVGDRTTTAGAFECMRQLQERLALAQTPQECTNLTPTDQAMRCMVTGFPVAGSKCNFVWTTNLLVPRESGSNVMRSLGCGRDKPFLCNPLVFGLEADNKPHCVARGENMSLTKACNDKVKDQSEEEIAKVADLIAANEEAWDSFLEGFAGLCDAQKIQCNPYLNYKVNEDGSLGDKRDDAAQAKNDVLFSCKPAYDRLQQIRGLINLTNENKREVKGIEGVKDPGAAPAWRHIEPTPPADANQ